MSDAIKLALDKCEKAAIESGAHESYQIVRESFAELRAALAALRAQPAEPLVFGMRGPKMTFTIGNQSFTLDYEPETTDEYVFMGTMLKAAISKLPRGVKIGAQPDHSEQHLEMVDHSELVKKLRRCRTSWPLLNTLLNEAADALEGKAIGETIE